MDGTAVGTVAAIGPDDDPIKYSLTSCSEYSGCPFSVLANGSILYSGSVVVSCRNFEESWSFQVEAAAFKNNLDGPTLSSLVTVFVTAPVLPCPPQLSTSSRVVTVAESVGVSSLNDVFYPVVLTPGLSTTNTSSDVLMWVDTGTTDQITFPFLLLPNGSLLVTARLDYEDISQYSLAIGLLDMSSHLQATDTIEITVLNVNDRPDLKCNNANVVFSEGFLGTYYLTITASDSDLNDSVSLVIVTWSGGGAAPFSVSWNAASESAVLDVVAWMPSGVSWLVVQSSDRTGATSLASCNITLTVEFENSPPSFDVDVPSVIAVPELTHANTVIATIRAVDRDDWQQLRFEVESVVADHDGAEFEANGLFTVRASSVDARMADLFLVSADLDFEVVRLYFVSLLVHDDGICPNGEKVDGLSAQGVWTVEIVDVSDAPVIDQLRVVNSSEVLDGIRFDDLPALAPSGSVRLDISGGDVLFVTGYYLGSKMPAGLPSELDRFELLYWDSTASGGSESSIVASRVYSTTACVVISGPDDTWFGAVACVSTGLVGFATSARLSVSGVVSSVFTIPAPFRLASLAPEVAAVSPSFLTTSGHQVVGVCIYSWGQLRSVSTMTSPASPVSFVVPDRDANWIWSRSSCAGKCSSVVGVRPCFGARHCELQRRR